MRAPVSCHITDGKCHASLTEYDLFTCSDYDFYNYLFSFFPTVIDPVTTHSSSITTKGKIIMKPQGQHYMIQLFFFLFKAILSLLLFHF